jgi:hypothetical protein
MLNIMTEIKQQEYLFPVKFRIHGYPGDPSAWVLLLAV